ncbi:di-heme oxidoredictase family protein [uncultured Gilvimarinus sp.]|uniref:di-heme oxidoredictase family protein n=1 Tax=uncultured Gilvimarinus sp. TaxID=1689143 RepID=UPI0030DC38BC
MIAKTFSRGALAALIMAASTGAYAQISNLSGSATASASTQDLPASAAIDGDGNTRWASTAQVDPSSLTLDLGDSFALSEVIIYWEAANANEYEIQGSNDGNTWSTIATRSGGAFGDRTDTVPVSGNYRYVRMHGVSRSAGNNWGYSIWEMEVYGAPVSQGSEVELTNLGGMISSQYADSPAGEGHGDAVDNNVNTKYLTFHNASWLQYEMAEPYVVKRYSISSANDSPERDPASWTLQGSNDGNNWTAIDARINEDFANRHQTREFAFSNTTAYRYYRLDMSNNSGNILQLSEFELFGVSASGSTSAVPVRIEAEDYDAFYDTSAGNNGTAYRSDDVDIEANGGGYNVGWMEAGEWLEYNVALGAGTYDIGARVASDTGGGAYSISVAGGSVSGNVPATGGWQAWQEQDAGSISVAQAGNYTVRLDVTSAGMNLDWLHLEPAVSSSSSSVASSSSSASGNCDDGCLSMINGQTLRATVSQGDTVDIHYSINGSAQNNVRMNEAAGQWSYDIPGLNSGDVVSVSFTVITNGAGQSLPWRDYTVGGSNNSSSSTSSSSSSSSSSSTNNSSSSSSTPAGGPVTPLYNSGTPLEPVIQFDRGDALVTRFSDRGRDRHAKEDHFQAYEHYLTHYWEDRTAAIEIVDYVAKGGDTIRMNVVTQFKLNDTEAENRWFYRGVGTVAEFCDNGTMEVIDDTHYYKERSFNCREGRAIQIGDKMEFELSQFLDHSVPNGRSAYYGSTYLYIVGEGLVPWEVGGATPAGGVKDSVKIPEKAWLGGHTTVHAMSSNEPDNLFLQMATNIGYDNAQPFMLGRRVLHSSFVDGLHDENPIDNPAFNPAIGRAGPLFVNSSCTGCHVRNGRAAANPVGEHLDKWVFKVGDANGNPHPQLGRVLQPEANGGAGSEGQVAISSWTEQNGLRSPNFQFTGVTPETFSARIAPQLVGMGLLEAISESDVLAQEDPNDANGDGISGRANRVADPATGATRLGRFGWKAAKVSVKDQVAGAFNTDMGVMTSLFPNPDCGSAQANCGSSGSELADSHVDNVVKYVSLLGVRAQRNYNDAAVINGENLFESIGCADCHTPSYQTSQFHPLAELRSQAIQPYTDLLLHDMGPGLADNLGEGDATGSEWRTTPLWGLGLAACVTGGTTNAPQGQQVCTPVHSYLHDGRARSIDEAIRWHGGEGEASRQGYEGLSQSQKDDVLAFLRSL